MSTKEKPTQKETIRHLLKNGWTCSRELARNEILDAVRSCPPQLTPARVVLTCTCGHEESDHLPIWVDAHGKRRSYGCTKCHCGIYEESKQLTLEAE